MIFRQGDEFEVLVRVESGFIKLSRSSTTSDVLIGWRPPGSWLGVSSAMTCEPHRYTAEAVGLCTLRQLTVQDYGTLHALEPELGAAIHRGLLDELDDALYLVDSLSKHDRLDRLERLLIRWFRAGHRQRSDGALEPLLPLRRVDLAHAIGVAPEHLSRLLLEAERQGTICRSHGWILLPPASRVRSHLEANSDASQEV